MAVLAFVLSAYLLGSLPQVYWLLRLGGGTPHENRDLHEYLWTLNHKLGAAGFLVDMAKGPSAILIGRGLDFPPEAVALAGLSVVVGQMWPAYFLRSGGEGNSTGMTMAAALSIYPFLIALVPVIAGLGWRVITHLRSGQAPLGPPSSRSLPLGMAIAFATLPLSSWLLNEPLYTTLAFLGLFMAIMTRRLAKGLISELRTRSPTARSLLKRLLFD